MWYNNITMKKISLLLLISFTLSACSLGNNNTGVFDAGATSVEMWVVVDSPTDYSALIDLYHEQYPNIPVVVKKFASIITKKNS